MGVLLTLIMISLEIVEAPPKAVTLKNITNNPTLEVSMIMVLHASVLAGFAQSV